MSDAGAVFSFNEALSHADDLINCFTADFGHDEDGEATFRIKAQSYRLKRNMIVEGFVGESQAIRADCLFSENRKPKF